ncbi:hypothetical protein IPF37_04350 [bacterium]|nr:MAG: hypothetical protein IPF37_04350 [bacterium]
MHRPCATLVFMNILCFFRNYCALLMVLLLAGCAHKKDAATIAMPTVVSEGGKGPHLMVVFVHGTMLPLPSPAASFSLLQQTFSGSKDKKHQQPQKSWYQQYLDALKAQSIVRYQPLGPDGLHPIVDQPCARISANIFTEFLNNSASYYTFGWSGRLNQRHRKEAAEVLYAQLVAEYEVLKKRFGNVQIILLGHSHGGNVALNLAHAEEIHKKQLSIEKLILLGTPVQTETSHYAAQPCFKKVYNFYSKGDAVQTLDILSTSKRSLRKFDDHHRVVQIKLECGKVGLGHAELWLFGASSNLLYNRHLAIAPFPFVIFLPPILYVLDTQYEDASSVRLAIEKDQNDFVFLFSAKKKRFKQIIDGAFLKKYRTAIKNL